MSVALPLQTTTPAVSPRLQPVTDDTPSRPAVITVVTRIEVDPDEAWSVHSRMAQYLRELGAGSADVRLHPPETQEVAHRQRPVAVDSPRMRIVVPARLVTQAGRAVELTRLEFDLLLFLCENPGKVYTREQLLRTVWGMDYLIYSRTVDVHVRRLRKKLGGGSGVISTVRGVGYRFDDIHNVEVEYGW